MAAIVVVAALDDGRFHWSPMPVVGLRLGLRPAAGRHGDHRLAQAVNKFFEPGVRIQAERGHRVIDTGPYAVVRHPGYVGACLLFVGIALSLGSFWALIPAGLASLLLLLRTRWEDRTLQAELAGYKEYTQRVRSRWIPGVWSATPERPTPRSWPGWSPSRRRTAGGGPSRSGRPRPSGSTPG